MTDYAANSVQTGRAFGYWPRRAEAWLDQRGKGAWIAAMVLGFIAFWPIGLALVIYMSIAGKWSIAGGRGHRRSAVSLRSSGNMAFDAYKSETLRRLEEEQDAFESFLERLRAAKDKAEFDQFMEDRARNARETGSSEERAG